MFSLYDDSVNKWHVHITVMSPVMQKLAWPCINQLHRKSLLKEVWDYQGNKPCKFIHQSHFSVRFFFSYSAKTSLIIRVFHWCSCPRFNHGDGEEAGCRSVAQSLSAHSGPLVCSVWGTDNFHWADWAQELISCLSFKALDTSPRNVLSSESDRPPTKRSNLYLFVVFNISKTKFVIYRAVLDKQTKYGLHI